MMNPTTSSFLPSPDAGEAEAEEEEAEVGEDMEGADGRWTRTKQDEGESAR